MAVISIIIPVYNVHNQLIRCLESVRNQLLEDYECILIDDGSTDGSADIVDKYAQMDSRFIAVHQSNLGVGAARNIGLQTASGKFITFIDSDDKVEPLYLSNMLNGIGKQDILISGYTICGLEGQKEIGDVNGEASTSNMAMAMKEGLLNSCWGKLYKRDITQNFKFPEKILWGEDTYYLLSLLCKTKKIVFVSLHDYLYTYSTNGLANRFDKKKPFYLNVYYKVLIMFLEKWAVKGDTLYRETAIKVSQEILRTIDTLIDNVLPLQDETVYFDLLFKNPEVNCLFKYGVQLDYNPLLLKILSRFSSKIIWKNYVKVRRIILKGKK